MNAQTVSLTVNGRPVRLTVAARTHLADALREELLLTGTHLGCEHGVCGACTLLIDDAPQRACLTLAASCEGAAVRTIEGFDTDPLMEALRDAFSEHHALQCGYCTPGMLATAYDLVRRLPDADEARIRSELAGNLCRCTGYVGIVRAIQATLAAFPASHPGRAADGPAIAAAEPTPRIVADAAAGAGTAPAALTGTANGMTELTRSVAVDLSVAALWRLLRDIERVAACIPGVTLTATDTLERVCGILTVAVGPMRARFEGTAAVAFDDAARRGSVVGRGQDKLGRSSAQGEVHFRAEPDGDGARLTVAMRYAVTGPFAQFSRGALVAEVVARLLETFAANLVRAAKGEDIVGGQALGATGLGLAVLKARLAAYLRKLRDLFRS
jgi:carbon-monoxide dehydrogenase small subunit